MNFRRSNLKYYRQKKKLTENISKGIEIFHKLCLLYSILHIIWFMFTNHTKQISVPDFQFYFYNITLTQVLI